LHIILIFARRSTNFLIRFKQISHVPKKSAFAPFLFAVSLSICPFESLLPQTFKLTIPSISANKTLWFRKNPSGALPFNFVVAAPAAKALHSSVLACLASGGDYETIKSQAALSNASLFRSLDFFHPMTSQRRKV